MKSTFITFLLITASSNLFATVYSRPFTQYRISTDVPNTVKVRFVQDVMTDGCNHYSMSGDLRKVQLPEGASSIISDYVADFGVGSTEMFCGNTTPVLRTITSDWMEVKNEYMVTILAPADLKIEVQETIIDAQTTTDFDGQVVLE